MTRIIYDGGLDDVRYRGLLGRRGAWGSAARVYGDGPPWVALRAWGSAGAESFRSRRAKLLQVEVRFARQARGIREVWGWVAPPRLDI